MKNLINVRGKLLDLETPCVMGVLNVTPDSFYAGSRKQTDEDIMARANQIISEGGSIIDIGAYSSRPYADDVSPEEEMRRLKSGIAAVRRAQPEAVISVDTFRADVARACIEEYGADIINDISAGELDSDMFQTVARLNVPYILMHMKGTPQNMQKNPHYDNLMAEIMLYFAKKVEELRQLGVKDMIIDPGFGFAKSLDDNYKLLSHMEYLNEFELPVLVGVSRKSMIFKLFGCTPDEALNGTTVIDTIALMKGASILRVHDVRQAVEAVTIYQKMK